MNADKHRQFKDDLYEQFARIGKALSSGRRLELIDFLAQAERSVEDLSRLTGMSMANCSQHLQVLRGAGLVSVRREGLFAYYRLGGPNVASLWLLLRRVGEEQLAEISRAARDYFTHRDSFAAVSCEDLHRRLAEGEEVTVLDVRPSSEYAQGHIEGARSIPLAELRERLAELPARHTIVAYCRGPYCVLTDDAVQLLAAHGFHTLRLELGYPDWAARGLPTATGDRRA